MKVYLASGWFSPEQEIARSTILRVLNELNIHVYSPKEDFLYVKGVTLAQDVFDANIRHILDSHVIIASTVGRDMGTIFECGYAHASGIPIVYYWPNPEGKFNLMLSQTGKAVLNTQEELKEYLAEVVRTNCVFTQQYIGDIE